MSIGLDPRAFPTVTPVAPGRGIERPPNGSGTRVLVVESDPGLRRWYRQALADAGYRVDEAPGGEEALERLRDEPAPDAMVLEVELAGMSGIELLRRALVLHPGLAVVFNTKCEAFKAHFGTWGADRFVVKSSDLSELKTALAEVLTHCRS
jgi:DNA-binding response OmpR family regulator